MCVHRTYTNLLIYCKIPNGCAAEMQHEYFSPAVSDGLVACCFETTTEQTAPRIGYCMIIVGRYKQLQFPYLVELDIVCASIRDLTVLLGYITIFGTGMTGFKAYNSPLDVSYIRGPVFGLLINIYFLSFLDGEQAHVYRVLEQRRTHESGATVQLPLRRDRYTSRTGWSTFK